MKHKNLLLLPVVLLLCSGCPSDPKERPGRRGQAVSTTVTYTEVRSEPVALHLELSGRTQALLVAEVRPQVSGIIQKRLFTEGAQVKAGELLYQIDPAPYRAAQQTAKAELAQAKALARAAQQVEERYRPLVGKAISQQDYDNALAEKLQAEAKVEAATAALDTATINLNYTKIQAPVSGHIGRSRFTPGALVTANQAEALATVQQLDALYVDLSQSTAEWLALREALSQGHLRQEESRQVTLILENGQIYSRTLADGSKEPILGELQFADVTVQQGTGAITLRALFPNPEGLLLPGMYVRARLPEGLKEQALLVPQRTVRHDNRGQPLAYVLRAQEQGYVLEPRTLVIDRALGDRWLVSQGLQQGDWLVVERDPRLPLDQLVQAQPWEE